MNLLQLAQRLHRECRRSTAAPTSISGATERNARMFDRITDAWRELQNERDWKWMRLTTDVALSIGQQTYSGTDMGLSRFRRWRREDSTYWPSLYIDGSPNSVWPMTFSNLDCFRQNWIYRSMGSSTPVAWSIDESERMLVGPAPAAAYKLRAEYWMEPLDLEADDDEPDMPARFHLLLVWRGLIDEAKADAKPELLALAEQNYARMHMDLLLDQGRLPYVA